MNTLLRSLPAVAVVPVCFVAILWGWGTIDWLLGRAEVARFIRNHERLIEERLRDPKVHRFSLEPHPDHSGTLLIKFDVDDKQTYEMLEADLDGVWHMTFPPCWETHIRSDEELANDLGCMAMGMGLTMEAATRIGIAAFVSIILFPPALWLFVLRRKGKTVRHTRAFAKA